jgi:hypothetical protein
MKTLKLLIVIITMPLLSSAQNEVLTKLIVYRMNLNITTPIGFTCDDLIARVTEMCGSKGYFIDTITTKHQLDSIKVLMNRNPTIKRILEDRNIISSKKSYPDIRLVAVLNYENKIPLKLCFGTTSKMVINGLIFKKDEAIFDKLLVIKDSQKSSPKDTALIHPR